MGKLEYVATMRELECVPTMEKLEVEVEGQIMRGDARQFAS